MKNTVTALAVLLMIVFIALACDEAGETQDAENAERTETSTPDRTETEPEEDFEIDVPEEFPEDEEDVVEETPEPTPAGPERIRFRKGMSEGNISLSLAPNEIKRYVVGVGPAQYFHVGVDDERLDISLPSRSRLSEIRKGDSFVDGVTTSTGDIVFEIRNPTRSAIRSSAIVTIQHREPMDH